MRLIALLFLATTACSKDSTEELWRPDLACPNDPTGICESTEGPLLVGTGMRSIVPDCFESWGDSNDNGEYERSQGDVFLDCGCDQLCPEDDGYPGPDKGEGDEEYA